MAKPKLRFPEFIDDWEQRKLGEVFEQTSYLVNPNEEDIELWSLTVEDGLTPKTERYNREFLVKKEGNFKEVRPGNIVYNPMNMTLGAVGYNGMDKTVAVSGYYTTMVAKNQYDAYYINTWLKSPQALNLYRTYATGTLIEKQRVQFPTLSIIPATFPQYEEQVKIGTIFKNIDNTISLQQREVEALEKQKKAVMQKIFSQQIRFKKDDGTDYPEWEEKRLKDCGRFYTGTGFGEAYQGHRDLPIDVYKVSDMNNIGNEKYMTYANNTVDDEILKQIKSKCINDKCLIFAKVGAAIYGERKRITTKPFLIDNNMMAFKPSQEMLLEYLHAWSLSVRFSQYAQVGALPSYNSSDIGIIKINIPCLEEQQKIADLLSDMDNAIDLAKQELEKWKLLKKGLLQQMFV